VNNLCDLASFVNVASLAPLLFLGRPEARTLGAIGTVLMLPKMANIARGAKKYSLLTTMLGEIIADMIPFLLLMAFVIVANAFAFYLLAPTDTEGFESYGNSWFTAYSLMLGEFEGSSYQGSFWMNFFFHYYTIFVNIVLLNVLIAIISDTHERVQEKSDERFLLMRAHYILDMEADLSKRAQFDPLLFPKWAHVLVRVEESSEQLWTGRLQAIKAYVDDGMEKAEVRIYKRLGHEFKSLQGDIQGMLNDQKKDIEAMITGRQSLHLNDQKIASSVAERLRSLSPNAPQPRGSLAHDAAEPRGSMVANAPQPRRATDGLGRSIPQLHHVGARCVRTVEAGVGRRSEAINVTARLCRSAPEAEDEGRSLRI